MSYKLDLHTHSDLSHDGSITLDEYTKILDDGVLDYVAVTDHNEIANALKIHKKLGDRIIVGEEIKTKSGEIIGLFLKKKIPKDLTLQKTIKAIKDQGGLVYVPHPFDTRRSGIDKKDIQKIIADIDIFEIFNARFIWPMGGNKQAESFAKKHKLQGAVGSDSHSMNEIGKTYSIIKGSGTPKGSGAPKSKSVPTAKNLPGQLKGARYSKQMVSAIGFLNPKRNVIQKNLKRQKT